MIKQLLIVIYFTLSCINISAANWEWVTSAGSSGMDRVWDIALDNQGNILVTGEFTDTLQIGDTVIPGWGLNDIFVAKFSPSGIPLWAKAFGGSEGDIGLSIDTDSLGNCYVTGYYGGTAHFAEHDLVTVGSWDIYVLKLNSNGDILWVYSEGGVSNDIGYGLAVTPDGRCIVTGWFGDTITFHDNSSLTSNGGSDILAYAYAANGDILWRHKAGAIGVEYGYKVDVDAQGNSYITGSAGQDADFDGISAPGDGAFIASYSSDGVIRWVNSGVGAGVNSIAVDRTAATIEQLGCITGRITGNAVFGDIAVSSLNGSDDAYGAVFELLTGNWISANIGGGTGSDKGRACAYKGHPYYTGSFEDTARLFGFDVTSSGLSDGFVYSSGNDDSGWILRAGGSNNDTPTDITIDNDGNVFLCGWYSGLARFGSTLMINSGNDSDLDIFVAKINVSTLNEENTIIPEISAMKCYPNPFKEKLVIQYQPSGKAIEPQSELVIYNVKGSVVYKTIAHCINPDSWQAEWNGYNINGDKCPTGVYFLKESGHNSKTKKVMLLN